VTSLGGDNLNSSSDLRVGFYENTYEIDATEDIEIVDVIRMEENANIGYISNIKMELYPVSNNSFSVNGKTIKSFDGTFNPPSELEISSLKIRPIRGSMFRIIYYYYL
jgi:hypothetical protein